MTPIHATDIMQGVDSIWHDAFYKFVSIADPEALVSRLERVCQDAGVLGSILVASEGVNGMLCGTNPQLEMVRAAFGADDRFSDVVFKRTPCAAQVFGRLKIKRKQEIVPLGIPNVDATLPGGINLSPLEWREFLQREDVVVIDNRNSFEYNLGHFKGALNPSVDHFRDFAAYLEAKLPELQGKQVAMYCTGGIRCEKTSAWLAQRGMSMYQLQGGILNYFLQLPNAELDYEGVCFVFDERHALNPQLETVAVSPD